MFEIEANILELKSEFFLSFFWVFFGFFFGFFLYMWGVYDRWFGITERPAGAWLNKSLSSPLPFEFNLVQIFSI